MVRTKIELLEDFKALGEDVTVTEAAINLLENISDTMDSLADIVSEEEINARIDEAVKTVDDEWRKKYTDRFFNNDADAEIEKETDVFENDDDVNVEKIDDLFIEESEDE